MSRCYTYVLMVDVNRLEEALFKVVVRSLQMYNRYNQIIYMCVGGGGCTRWRSREVAGSIPDGAIGTFPSGRTMAVWSSQPLAQLSSRNISCSLTFWHRSFTFKF
jgi:hypothetical protein